MAFEPFKYQMRSNEDWESRLNQSGGGDFQHFYKNEFRTYRSYKGENHIRILPPTWKGARHYGLDVYVHYGVGPSNADVICLEQGAPQIGRSGQACPLCRERNKLMQAGEEEEAKKLRVVKRVVCYVLDRKDEAKGVLLWACPYTLDQEISDISRNRSRGTWYIIDHHEEGYDIYFKRSGEMMQTQYSAPQKADHPSPVDPKWIDWAQRHPIPDCLQWRDAAEIKRLWEGRGRGEEPEEVRSARQDYDDDGRMDDEVEGRGYEPEARQPEPPPQTSTPRKAVRRPRSATGDSNGDGDPDLTRAASREEIERAKRGAPPSSDGNMRADEVRARFMNRRE